MPWNAVFSKSPPHVVEHHPIDFDPVPEGASAVTLRVKADRRRSVLPLPGALERRQTTVMPGGASALPGNAPAAQS